MALERLRQVLIREQADPSAFSSPLAAAYGKYLPSDVQVTREVSKFARNLARDTTTGVFDLVGTRRARISYMLELAGQAVTTPDVPVLDLSFRACGLKSVATSYITTTAAGVAGSTGPLRHGETITQTSTNATAVVLHDTYPSGAITTVYVWNVTGSPNNSAVWTGGTSGATFTPSVVPTDAGQSWFPVSKHTSQISYTGGSGTQFAIGTPIKGATSGARAVVTDLTVASGTWAGNNGAGGITFRYYSGTFQSGEEIQNATGTSNHCDSSSTATQVDVPAVSAAIIEDGKLDLVYAARGTFRFVARIGEPVKIGFELYGPMSAPSSSTDQALITGITHETKIPPLFLGTSMKLGHEGDASTSTDYTPRISSFEFAMNNELAIRENAAVGDGYEDCVITGRSVSGSFDPELDLESSYSFFQDFTGQSSVYLGRTNFNVGSTAGNKFFVSMPGMQYDPPSTQGRNGVLAYNFPFRATGGYHSTETAQTLGSDNEFCITYLLV